MGAEAECWEWQGSRKAKGYGRFHLDGRMQHAHRVAHAIEIGEVPPGSHVLHKCDNPRCCNPAHLALGSALDNTRDMVQKDRHARAERHGKAKLTSEIAAKIRASNEAGSALSEAYGVHQSVISSIKLGKHWKPAAIPVSGPHVPAYRVTGEDLRLRKDGAPMNEGPTIFDEDLASPAELRKLCAYRCSFRSGAGKSNRAE